MTYQILFLDIDGTILKPDHTYTDLTKEAISQVKEQGIEVFLSTGRPLHEIGELAEELGIESFIGYNGAYAVYQNEIILDEPMKEETINEFLTIANENDHELVLYTSEKNYFTTMEKPLVKTFLHTFQVMNNATINTDVTNQILGVTIMNLGSSQTSLYEFEDGIHLSPVTVAGIENTYDVIRKTVNKGEAVNHVLQRLDIPKEAAIAFGDGMNDKEMLQTVGEGFAMGNAHPELFKYANQRTTTVTESGIYYGLKKLGLVK
ncbi:Cof-type HAD-IIB family hydrolase [Ornithinibacillus sp. L9]|uniref:Cof-type HAD-IIB family hydrolase n=1 Tax=Ornithinibacillus caprae TaxID=2678566 RepID=A0A6N8FR27_9BACI|nr:HAD family hydrolase [Ornithinibacillus caprae]MUK90148.1 Cof-type HAD-IIB family hydrolase [Ornithinibacillus caprae]